MPWLAEIYEPWSDMSLETAKTEGEGPWSFLDVVESCRLYFPIHLVTMLQHSDACSFRAWVSSLVFLALPAFFQ